MEDSEILRGDKLILRGLKFHGYHGVKPEERKLGQKFLIDVDAWMDLRKAGQSDQLTDTLSYTDIYRIVKEVVEGPPQNLLESVAQLVASTTLSKHPQVSAIRVKVGKPHVAVQGPVDYLGVEILRYRSVEVLVGEELINTVGIVEPSDERTQRRDTLAQEIYVIESEDGANSVQSKEQKKCRRTWTEFEEETLLTILEELVVAGLKRENGSFKIGTHEEVWKRMKNSIPGIVLTVNQVVNKMKRWSNKLGEVVDMLNTSGFSWDDTKKCVIADNGQVLTEYLEKHPKVGNHVNKEFKEFERLQGIFGKDCANGRVAETPADTVEGIQRDYQNDFEEDVDTDQPPQSPTLVGHMTSAGAASSAARPSCKRSRVVEIGSQSIEIFDRNMGGARADLALILGKMPEPPKGGLVQELKSLGLTEDEAVDVIIKFSHNPQYEKYFWELQGTQRMTFLERSMKRDNV